MIAHKNHHSVVEEYKMGMTMQRNEKGSSDERYAVGARVQIIGGVYRRGSPVGTIVGTTRYYIDVEVPCLNREVRVRKTSVVHYESGKGEDLFKRVLEEEPMVGVTLRAVCAVLVKRGVKERDEGLHDAIDVYLSVAMHQEGDVTKRKE
jgi:hypothetical protein